jgi:EF-hand domain pair
MVRLLIGALLLGVGGLAGAQPPGPLSFDDLDTDGNGTLSQAEVESMFATFAGRRPSTDGEEPPPGRGPDPAMIFDRWDANGDGAVSRDEFEARPRFGRGSPRGPGGERPPEDAPRRIL